PPSLDGDNSSYAYGIGEDGVIIGVSEMVTVRHVGNHDFFAVVQKAVIWQDGQVINLNDLVTDGDPLDLKVAVSRSAKGKIVGKATLRDGTTVRGFLFDNGHVTDLGDLIVPAALNRKGAIVGGDIINHAVVWDDGQTTDLHKEPLNGLSSAAFGVSDDGMIV